MDAAEIITPLLIAVVVPLVIRAVSRSAASDYVAGTTSISLRYGVPMKAMGLMSLVIGAFMIAGPLLVKPTAPAVLPITAPLGAMLSFLFFEVFLVRHRADLTGVTCGSVFHRPLQFRWAELKSLDYGPTMGWFVLRSTDGRVGRVSGLVGGVRGFAALAIAHANRSTFTANGWKYANDAAAGKSIIKLG